jgi:hypothetical protein
MSELNKELVIALRDMLRQFVDSTVPLEQQFNSADAIKTIEFAVRALERATGARVDHVQPAGPGTPTYYDRIKFVLKDAP